MVDDKKGFWPWNFSQDSVKTTSQRLETRRVHGKKFIEGFCICRNRVWFRDSLSNKDLTILDV